MVVLGAKEQDILENLWSFWVANFWGLFFLQYLGSIEHLCKVSCFLKKTLNDSGDLATLAAPLQYRAWAPCRHSAQDLQLWPCRLILAVPFVHCMLATGLTAGVLKDVI